MAGRLAHVTILRVFSTFYIIGFWHLMNYTKLFPGYYNPVTVHIIPIIMGLFIFISGYLLALKKDDMQKHGVGSFYMRRITRVYPLFLVTLCIWIVLGLDKTHILIKSAFLITPVFGRQPYTLWFVINLIIYYLAAPFLIRRVHDSLYFILTCVNVFLFFLFITVIADKGDIRLALYFPAFACGIFFSNRDALLYKYRIDLFLAFIFSLFCSVLSAALPELDLWSIPMTCTGPMLLLVLSSKIPKVDFWAHYTSPVAYASYVMYLLHRPIYKELVKLFPFNDYRQLLFLVCAGLPIVILLSWVIQKGYDLYSNKLLLSLKSGLLYTGMLCRRLSPYHWHRTE